MAAAAEDFPFNQPLGLILAGGRGRRMGDADKALIRLAGRPLIAHAIAALESQCAGLIINANGAAERLRPYALPIVADDPQNFAGPLAGVLAGLEFARRIKPEIADVLSLAVDTPFAPRDLVERLQAARKATGAAIAVAASGGNRHHVVALWPVALAEFLRRALTAEGVRKVEVFAERFGVAVATWDDEPFDPFFNINTPDDLARAEKQLAHSGPESQ
jgi:molybdopterin-guanine dinucleotide biosynthesis protein A